MRLPFGLLLAIIFLISLEDILLLKLRSYLRKCKIHTDNIFVYVLSSKIGLIIREINSYHKKAKLTCEIGSNKKLVSLYLCVISIMK